MDSRALSEVPSANSELQGSHSAVSISADFWVPVRPGTRQFQKEFECRIFSLTAVSFLQTVCFVVVVVIKVRAFLEDHCILKQQGDQGFLDYVQCGRPEFDPWVGKIPWRRAWQPTSVFLPGEFPMERSLGGYSPWGLKESDTTEQLRTVQHRLWE